MARFRVSRTSCWSAVPAVGPRWEARTRWQMTHKSARAITSARDRSARRFGSLISSRSRQSSTAPAPAQAVASLWHEDVLSAEHRTLQDTNDRFLANMQRGGSYSIVPRVPGGEITPDKLIVLGAVAKQYGLYTKITGGQRIDLFGAQAQDLPE